jgi:hypothetical protein
MFSLKQFVFDDAGAVTIDWVALTAAILLLGIMVVYSIFNGGVSSLTSNIGGTLSGISTAIDIGAVPNINGQSDGGGGSDEGDPGHVENH